MNNKYLLAILAAMSGSMVMGFNGLMWALLGGTLIGTGLYLARTSGLEDNE